MKYLYLTLIILVAFGCKKDEELKLIYPLESDVVPLNGLNFEWKNTFSDISYITISEDEFFTDIISTKTITGANNFTFVNPNDSSYPIYLSTNKIYYWKIEDQNGLSESSSFMIKDYLSDYEGIHQMSAKRYNTGFPSPTVPESWYDTVYYDGEIELTKREDVMSSSGNISHGFSVKPDSLFFNISETGSVYYKFNRFNTDDNKIRFLANFGWNSYYQSYLDIDIETDSIFFWYSYGNVSYRIIEMEGKYE